MNLVLRTEEWERGVFGSEIPHVMLPTLTSRSRRPSSQPPPVSAGRWPASPEHGPAPPPPAGSCGSKMPPRPRPAGAHRGRGGDRGREWRGWGGMGGWGTGQRSGYSQETRCWHKRKDSVRDGQGFILENSGTKPVIHILLVFDFVYVSKSFGNTNSHSPASVCTILAFQRDQFTNMAIRGLWSYNFWKLLM